MKTNVFFDLIASLIHQVNFENMCYIVMHPFQYINLKHLHEFESNPMNIKPFNTFSNHDKCLLITKQCKNIA
jgi:hypothetical protein